MSNGLTKWLDLSPAIQVINQREVKMFSTLTLILVIDGFSVDFTCRLVIFRFAA